MTGAGAQGTLDWMANWQWHACVVGITHTSESAAGGWQLN